MNKEAYCSYEISKLLKEKEFDEPTLTFYIPFDDGEVKFNIGSNEIHYNTLYEYPWIIAAPTHQMAYAWLREKGIECVVIPIWNTIGKQYRSYVLSDLGDKYKDNYDSYSDNISYEEAVEAALKYSLEKLI